MKDEELRELINSPRVWMWNWLKREVVDLPGDPQPDKPRRGYSVNPGEESKSLFSKYFKIIVAHAKIKRDASTALSARRDGNRTLEKKALESLKRSLATADLMSRVGSHNKGGDRFTPFVKDAFSSIVGKRSETAVLKALNKMDIPFVERIDFKTKRVHFSDGTSTTIRSRLTRLRKSL